MSEPRFSKNGDAAGISFHDSVLVEFCYFAHTKQMRLGFESAGKGKERSLVLGDEVLMLNVLSLWEGTIVSQVTARPISSLSIEPQNQADGVGWGGLFLNRLRKIDYTQKAEWYVDNYPDALLLEVCSSYGGHIFALAENFKIVRT